MRTEKSVIYVPDATVAKAREMGLANLSEFVRNRLDEFIEAGGSVQANTPTADHEGGQYNVDE